MPQKITLLEKALQASPENWQVRRSLAAQYAQSGHADEAARLMLEAPEIPAEEKDQIFAAQLMADTHPAEAHQLLDAFLEENAASGQGHLLKGRLHRAEGDSARAESHFKVAAVLDPSIDIEGELATARDESIAVVEVTDDNDEEEVAVAIAVADPDDEIPAVAVAPSEPAPEAATPTESLPEIPAPVPLSPKPMAPPPATAPANVAVEDSPEEEAEPESAEPESAAETVPEIQPAAPIHSEFGTGEEVEEAMEGEEFFAEGEDGEYLEEGERAFIVGEGEMVHAHEKDPDGKEKVSAITAAILVHVVIAFLLALWVVTKPRPNPPQITASAVSNTDNPDVEAETVTKIKPRTTSASSSSLPVISANSFSSLSIPDAPTMNTDLTMLNIAEGDSGLGMSMSGFGDVSNMSAIPPSMRSRCSMSQRMQRLRESGGEDRAERAVRNALTWIASQQNKDGSFGKKYQCAMSGFALLAFLGHCETPESPKFGEAVVGSAQYLIKVAKRNDGFMTTKEKGGHQVYQHAIATYALCELYTLTKESGRPVPGLESVLRKAVKRIVEGQSEMGGWAYGYNLGKNNEDMSVSGWQIQALKAAHNTGKKFRGVDQALDQTMEYLREIQDKEGAFRYRPDKKPGKPTLTGAALLGMQIWDEMGSPEYNKGLAYLSKKYANPTPGSNFYAPYYNTQVFFLNGGKEWEAYNGKFQAKLLDAQNPDGSWTKDVKTGHGQEDAHIMNTAWGCLMLEVYYRYLPTTEKVKGLKAK